MADEREEIGWAVVEQLGHKKMAGYVQEVELAGSGFLRVDVYTLDLDAGVVATQFIQPSSVYCITPTIEELARTFGDRARPAPVARYELPAAVPAGRDDEPDEDDVDDLDY